MRGLTAFLLLFGIIALSVSIPGETYEERARRLRRQKERREREARASLELEIARHKREDREYEIALEIARRERDEADRYFSLRGERALQRESARKRVDNLELRLRNLRNKRRTLHVVNSETDRNRRKRERAIRELAKTTIFPSTLQVDDAKKALKLYNELMGIYMLYAELQTHAEIIAKTPGELEKLYTRINVLRDNTAEKTKRDELRKEKAREEKKKAASSLRSGMLY